MITMDFLPEADVRTPIGLGEVLFERGDLRGLLLMQDMNANVLQAQLEYVSTLLAGHIRTQRALHRKIAQDQRTISGLRERTQYLLKQRAYNGGFDETTKLTPGMVRSRAKMVQVLLDLHENTAPESFYSKKPLTFAAVHKKIKDVLLEIDYLPRRARDDTPAVRHIPTVSNTL